MTGTLPATALALAYLAVLAVQTRAALAAARRAPAAAVPDAVGRESVVIAQAILSGDPDLAASLAANPAVLSGVRFLWLVDEDDPRGRETAAAVRAAAPQPQLISLLTCPPPPPGANPKVWKLERAEQRLAPGDILVVLDDDTRLPAASLGALLAGLERGSPTAGPVIATGLPAYERRGPWASRLLAQFVDDRAARTYLAPLARWGARSLNGMTYALRAGDLARLGGFVAIRHRLTDDLALARRLREQGGRIVQTAAPQWLTTTVGSAREYLALLHRWFLFASLLLREERGPVRAALLAGHVLPPLLLLASLALAVAAPGRGTLLPLLALLGLRSGLILFLQRRILGRWPHRPLASLVAELLIPVHLVHALVRPVIRWRSRRYRVLADDDFRRLP